MAVVVELNKMIYMYMTAAAGPPPPFLLLSSLSSLPGSSSFPTIVTDVYVYTFYGWVMINKYGKNGGSSGSDDPDSATLDLTALGKIKINK